MRGGKGRGKGERGGGRAGSKDHSGRNGKKEDDRFACDSPSLRFGRDPFQLLYYAQFMSSMPKS